MTLRQLSFYKLSTLDLRIYQDLFGKFNSDRFDKNYIKYMDTQIITNKIIPFKYLNILSRSEMAEVYTIFLFMLFYYELINRNII